MEPWGVALLGAGRIAGRHIGAINNTPPLAVRWVISRTPARAGAFAREHGIGRHGTNPEEAIADPDVRVVVVAYPTQQHARLIMAAFAAGKDVVCEKPLAWTAAEAHAVVAAAAQTGRRLAVCHIRRYWAPCVRLKEIAGDLGRIRGASWSYRVRQTWAMDWRCEQPGGYLLDAHVHDIDLLCWLVGRYPRQVVARGHNTAEGMGTLLLSDADDVLMRFDWDGGVIGRDYPAGAEHHGEIIGDRGWARLSIVAQQVTVEYCMEGMGAAAREEFVIGEVIKASWAAMWESFGRYLRLGDELAISGHSAALAVELCLGAVRSMESGETVSLGGL